MGKMEPPMCLGPGGDLAAEHEGTPMEPTKWDDDGWQCPVCQTIVRVEEEDDE